MALGIGGGAAIGFPSVSTPSCHCRHSIINAVGAARAAICMCNVIAAAGCSVAAATVAAVWAVVH